MIQNLEGHQYYIIGSKGTAILLNLTDWLVSYPVYNDQFSLLNKSNYNQFYIKQFGSNKVIIRVLYIHIIIRQKCMLRQLSTINLRFFRRFIRIPCPRKVAITGQFILYICHLILEDNVYEYEIIIRGNTSFRPYQVCLHL